MPDTLPAAQTKEEVLGTPANKEEILGTPTIDMPDQSCGMQSPDTIFLSGLAAMTVQVDQLFTALSAAQGELRSAPKDSTNPHFQSNYSDLASGWEACRAALSKHGLCVTQLCSTHELFVRVITLLAHKSGQWIKDSMDINIEGYRQARIHAVGSAITYARRYAMFAIVGLAPGDDDDDGNKAAARVPAGGDGQRKVPPKTATTQKPAATKTEMKETQPAGGDTGGDAGKDVKEELIEVVRGWSGYKQKGKIITIIQKLFEFHEGDLIPQLAEGQTLRSEEDTKLVKQWVWDQVQANVVFKDFYDGITK